MAESISLHEAAEKLGLHYMTVYRYVRTGRLSGTQVGGQWQIDPADLDSLNKPSAKGKPGRSPKGKRSWQGRFENQIVAGDEAGAWTVVQDALAAGLKPQDLYLDVLVPSLSSIGARWDSGEISVAQEHRASAIALRVVGRLGPQFARRGRKRGHILLGSPAGEHHGLPNALLADLLRGERFLVSDLGADVPTADFISMAKAAPDVVGVGIGLTMPPDQVAIQELIEGLHEHLSVPVFVGGSGVVDAQVAQGLGADIWTGQSPDLSWVDQLAVPPKSRN